MSCAAYHWRPLCLMLLTVSGCALPPPAAESQPKPATTLAADRILKVKATSYHIDPLNSSLHLLVYRGGPMARLGHNHVISSASVRGRVWITEKLDDSGFEISVPVNEFLVDDEAARATHGEDFAQPISEDARAGTKANMLRESLLDGARYPIIDIRSVRLEGSASSPSVHAAIRIKNQTREITLPVSVESIGGGLRIQGAFSIQQSDFGITPLSVAGGALQVVDTVRILFVLVAKPQ